MRSKNYAVILFVFVSIFTIFIFSLNASSIDPYSPNSPSAPTGTISFNINDTPTTIDSRLLGTNSPAWINPTKFSDSTFRTRATATGMTLNRFPGGSWSNAYDWLACERGGAGIDGDAVCWWTWAGRPTDFIDFAQATGGEVMYTINQNGTSKEAAALVAFFNGSVSDDTVIGVDVRGRDWLLVSDWAKLRRDNGNPDPLYVKYWEIGNETYGGNSGKDCFDWGWENDVWTCDGTEYVNGIDSGANRKEGFIEFRNAMRAVDSSIMVGAVGVTPQDGWTNWGNEVIAAAGDVMDFYIIHQYAFWSQPANYQEALAQPQTAWEPIMTDVENSFDNHAGGRRVPIAITEHNLFSFQDNDNGQWMKQAVNMLFMADSIGQMMEHGFAMGNQWNLANGLAGNGTDYGLLNVDSYARNPQYYVFPLWAGFGSQMLPVASSYDAATTLSVYAGKLDATTAVVLAINKTGSNQTADIQIDGVGQISGGTASVAQATSLDSQSVTFNGVSDPADDLSDAPPMTITGGSNPLAYTFAPYSVTLLQLQLGDQLSVDDVMVTEGDSNATFTVTLSPSSLNTVTVDYAISNGTATAGNDYTAVSSTLTFNPGQTTKTISVPIIDDTTFEAYETFTLALSNANNANIADTTGLGGILDDDATDWVYLPAILK